jgi:hypothetical protein
MSESNAASHVSETYLIRYGDYLYGFGLSTSSSGTSNYSGVHRYHVAAFDRDVQIMAYAEYGQQLWYESDRADFRLYLNNNVINPGLSTIYDTGLLEARCTGAYGEPYLRGWVRGASDIEHGINPDPPLILF